MQNSNAVFVRFGIRISISQATIGGSFPITLMAFTRKFMPESISSAISLSAEVNGHVSFVSLTAD
ncbi:hypothetical protein F4009_05955 [Candidatus Poribacteria bacterium]|nr:hypothetical protein [Candidatus Poribacteria bacterium]MYK93533.1 hypothetical protein [Candidatus Poribacteria bacterium]